MKLRLLSWVSRQVLRRGVCTVSSHFPLFSTRPFKQEHKKYLTSLVQWSLQPSSLSPAVTTGDDISNWLISRSHHLLSILLAFPQHLQLSYWGTGGHIPREAESAIFKTRRRVVILQPAPCKAHVTSYRLLCALVGTHPFQKAWL